MLNLVWLIPGLPLAAFVLITFFLGRFRLVSALTAIFSMAGAFVLSAGMAVKVFSFGITMNRPVELSVKWLDLPGLLLEMGALVDPLAVIMLLVVTSISLLVFIYSLGYMADDPGFSRFFSYLALFTFSMLGLVIANNYFQMYVFWELVGLSSYLLIGFWYQKNSAVEANKKAFITNRVADFGFLLGIMILFLHFGTFNFTQLAGAISGSADWSLLTLAGVLVFLGPMGKSGQFPLHVWLPDAMEGPTPVSALIHAATMVAAGVYLIARGFVLFAASEQTMEIIALIGGFTAFFAASIALVQQDLKRILAYSTLSQLGYMVLAMGVGSMTAGMFHLYTHAFFKALLFLGAGSVIHAVHEQNIMQLGGLSQSMRITAGTMVIAALAIAGVPPLSGFWSKDEILTAAFAHGHYGLYLLALLTAFMTAFYMFRMIFLVFYGKSKGETGSDHGHKPHESPAVMTVPLIILACFSIVGGLVGIPFWEHGFGSWIYFGQPHHAPVNWGVMFSSVAVGLAGIHLAWLMYYKKSISPAKTARTFAAIYRLLWNKYYIDEFYAWFFNRIVLNLATAFNWSDRNLVDGTAHSIGKGTCFLGGRLRFLQTGNLQTYALVIFIAVVFFLLLAEAPVLGGVR